MCRCRRGDDYFQSSAAGSVLGNREQPTIGADTYDGAAPARLTTLLTEAESGIPL